MDNLRFALEAAWQVLVAGLVLGAGLPAVFALGIRSLAIGSGGAAVVDDHTPHPAARLLAGLCFAIVVVGVALGITFIVASGFGKELSFANGFPTIVTKD